MALFSALALLGGMVVIALINQANPASVSTDYKNEDWEVPPVTSQPPPLAKPENKAEMTTLTKDNPLYTMSLESPVRCDLELLPGREQDDQELQASLQTYVGCLTRVWGPTLKQAGYTAFQPKLTVYPEGETIATGCGNQKSHNAFYCTLDQQIYISQDVLDVLSADVSKARVVFNLIIAHEYGHVVQGQSGILLSGHMAVDNADDSEKMDAKRRLETQADCFAGAALGSLEQGLKLTDTDRQDILAVTADVGDDRLNERANGDPDKVGDHGKSENRRLWAERGLNSGGSLGQCNTFNAPASEVE